jgi:hypothetical protein
MQAWIRVDEHERLDLLEARVTAIEKTSKEAKYQ